MIFRKISSSILISFFLFLSYNVGSQNIIVADSITKLPLPFVAIGFNNSGFYSSIDGQFDLSKVLSDSLEIRLLGYKTLRFKTAHVKDTIFLQQHSFQLDEIVLEEKQAEIENIKLLKSAKSFGSWPLQPESEILTFVYPSSNIKNYFIDKIIIQFKKVIEKKELKNTNIKAYVRINVYDSYNKNVSNPLYSSNPIDINSFDKDLVVFDVSEQLITLKENGVFVGLELIGYYLDSNEQENMNSVIRPELTAKTNDYFQSNSFIRYVFRDNEELTPINEIIRKESPKEKEISRNLNIGLELSK